MSCADCPCERTTEIPPDHRAGRILLVFDAPTELEAARREPLVGDTGALVRAVLAHLEIDLEEVRVAYATECRPTQGKTTLINNARKVCAPGLLETVAAVDPEVILCFGVVGWTTIAGLEKVPLISRTYNAGLMVDGRYVVPTFTPQNVLADPDVFRDFEFGVRKALVRGPQRKDDLDYYCPRTPSELADHLECLLEASVVSCDLETSGFVPRECVVYSIGFCALDPDGGGYAISIPRELTTDAKNMVADWFETYDGLVVFHNSKFDLKFLKWHGFGLPKHYADTMLMHYALDERPGEMYERHGLKTLARVHFDDPGYAVDMKTFLATPEDERPWDDLYLYQAIDCYYTRLLYDVFAEQIADGEAQALDLLEKVLYPAVRAFVDIELAGVQIDLDFFAALEKELLAKEKVLKARLRARVSEFDEDLGRDFNPASPKQVADYLYKVRDFPTLKTARRGKQQGGATSVEVLRQLKKRVDEEDARWIDDLLECRAVTKTIGTYVRGLVQRANDDGRVRSDFKLHGTATGRLSSSNPNLQNISLESKNGIDVRNGFIAAPGYVLIEADYSQLELRIAAHLSGDEEFTRVYQEGRDLHQEVAFALFHKPKEQVTKYERYMAKCCSFGVMYGRGAWSLAMGPEMDYVEEIGGDRWSVAEVEDFFRKFFDNFPTFREWTEQQSLRALQEQMVETPLGRRRRFPFISRNDNGATGRQGVNTPIQSLASDFTVTAIVRIHRRLKEEYPGKARIVSTVHDSILIEAKEEVAHEVAQLAHEEMEQNVPIASEVPFKADVEIGERWGSLKDD